MRPTTAKRSAAAGPSERDPTRLLEQLRRSHEELNHLVRAVSHDMGAHLMLLDNSFAQLKTALADQPQERPELGELVTHVEACLHESQRFLNDLAALVRTGSIEMEPERVELAAVLEEVCFEQRDLLAERNVHVERQRPLPVLWCNRHRLKQIVTNLVRNAIRHGCDPHQPRITVASADENPRRTGGGKAAMIAFRIHDNGPGIPKCSHEEIFLPGRRLPQAQGEGSGMGLAIVRKIAEHYGGSVTLDSNCPAGTAFIVALPAAMGDSVRGKASGRHVGCDSPHESQKPHALSTYASQAEPRKRG